MAGAPRSLTQMLREADDEALVELLLDRPDLADPPPTGFSQVASRATTRHSVSQAVHELTQFELWVARRVCAADGAVDAAAVAGDTAGEDVDTDAVAATLRRLRRLALVWGGPQHLRPVRALRSLVLADDESPGPPPATAPPAFLKATRQPPERVDVVAAGSAFEFVRRLEVLVEHCDHQPLRLRRDGEASARELRDLAHLLDVPKSVATGSLQIAESAHLLAPIPHGTGQALLPTAEFDRWQGEPLEEQWRTLLRAWVERHPASGSAALKRLCLTAFGDPDEGLALGKAELRTWLAWMRPLRPAGTDGIAATMLVQAAWLGITGLGALSSFGATADVHRLRQLLPERVEHVLVQADLTAVAPGPLTRKVAQEMGELAEVESRGGATVYRFSEASLRRAQQRGWSSTQILDTLTERSTTPLPQPLTYLIGDLDRPREVPGREPASTGRMPGFHDLPPRAPAPETPGPSLPDEAALREIVAGLRDAAPATAASEEREEHAGGPAGGNVFDSPLATLREAVETGETVWVGYVDTDGTGTERLVRAMAVDDGMLTARDSRSTDEIDVPVRRITAAHIIRAAPRPSA